MNITVRTDGIINNTLTEAQFVVIVEQLFGVDKTLNEYIKLYNNAKRAKFGGITVHKEVANDHAELEAKTKAENTIQAPADAEPEDYLEAATSILSAAVGKEVTIEFANDDE